MRTTPSRYFAHGFGIGMLLLTVIGQLHPVAANHAQSGCNQVEWSEVVKENNDEVEDGNHAKIKVAFPDGDR